MVQQAGDTVFAPGLPSLQVFTASGTWNKPSGLRHVIVEVVGGGGGTGGVALTGAGQCACASGGGAGGYSRKLILASALGASETVTVGTGGAGGAAGANNGVNGITSSFGSHCSAGGGALSVGQAAVTAPALMGTGGAGGSGAGGDLNIQGARGWSGIGFATTVMRAPGGQSVLSGTEPGGVSTGLTGAPGELYGGGGHGACNSQSLAAKAGGDGAPGVVIVTTYF